MLSLVHRFFSRFNVNRLSNTAFSLLPFIFLLSCNKGPEEKDIQNQIAHYYNGLSLQAGGGTYHPDEILIVSQQPQGADTVMVKAIVSGYYENNSLPEEANNKGPFSDTIDFLMYRYKENIWLGERSY